MALQRSSRWSAILVVGGVLALAGCNDGQSSSSGQAQGAAVAAQTGIISGTVSRSMPSISGSPAAVATVGTPYSFSPSASDSAGAALTFSIKNQPAWASFDSTSGLLVGTPGAADVGSSANIVISVSDGTSSAALPAFSIKVAPVLNASNPTIQGTAASTVVAGQHYSFRPTVTDPAGMPLTFSIANLPKWALFDPATGSLTGTPGVADVGAYSEISISVSDGVASAALAPFSIQVDASGQNPGTGTNSVTLSWSPPTVNTDGTTSTDLAGYRIYYGTSLSSLTQVVTVGVGETSYVFSALASGSWYFAVAAYNTAEVQSSLSAVASVTL